MALETGDPLGLNTEQARLRSIVEASGALILLADRDLRILMVNAEIAELTGRLPDDVVGRPMREIVDWPVEAGQLKEWREQRETEGERRIARLTCRHIDRAGHERLLSVTAKPILDEKGEVVQFVFVAVDDTARRDVEQALFATERLAAVGEMSAAVAHEIAQPLQIINLACHSALDELKGKDDTTLDVAYIRQKLERIAGQIDRSNRIVRDLRTFVRGAAADGLQAFDPADAVSSALDLTSHALKRAGIKPSLLVEGDGRKVMGHIGKLEQVLVNLINNARDSGGSGIDIVLSTQRSDSGGDQVRIVVQDNGPGIKPEVLDRLFNAFITTKPRGKGTGLGLRICRRIVEEMRGTIVGGNRPEGGARFEIVLPATDDQPS